MSERTEALRDELTAIEIWDEDYRRGDNPPFVDTLAWRPGVSERPRFSVN
jgi:hypothetical protein